MPVQFDVPDNAPTRRSTRVSLADVKDMFNTPEGKKLIRDSMTLKPISKEKRRQELDRLRKSFALEEDDVSNLKSCLIVKKTTGAIDHIKWRESKVLVEEFRISKVRASCWDDCFYTEVSAVGPSKIDMYCFVPTKSSQHCSLAFTL